MYIEVIYLFDVLVLIIYLLIVVFVIIVGFIVLNGGLLGFILWKIRVRGLIGSVFVRCGFVIGWLFVIDILNSITLISVFTSSSSPTTYSTNWLYSNYHSSTSKTSI